LFDSNWSKEIKKAPIIERHNPGCQGFCYPTDAALDAPIVTGLTGPHTPLRCSSLENRWPGCQTYKKELNAARRAGHLAYLQESLQANASGGSVDEAAPDLLRPTTADEPTEVPTQAPAKRNRTPATSTSEAGSTLGPAKRPTRKTHKTTNLKPAPTLTAERYP
ncbi:hypothetical protein Ptr86124_014077, partial [Pyrenophora tritici-repentis]